MEVVTNFFTSFFSPKQQLQQSPAGGSKSSRKKWILAAVFTLKGIILFKLLKYWMNPKHPLPLACPSREKPDPILFPQYFQNSQGMWLYWRLWECDAAKKLLQQQKQQKEEHVGFFGVILLVQGSGDYAARYEAIAAEFNKRGFSVVTCDHQGQGMSEGLRKYVEDADDYVRDQEEFFAFFLSKYPVYANSPRFVYSHSMGSQIAAQLAFRLDGWKDGKKRAGSASSSSSPKKSNNDNSIPPFYGYALGSGMFEIDKAMVGPVSRFIGKQISTLLPKFPIIRPTLPKMTRNEQFQQFIEQDPLCFLDAPIRARAGATILNQMDTLMKMAGSDEHGVGFSCLILHGVQDKSTPISGARHFYQQLIKEKKNNNNGGGGCKETVQERIQMIEYPPLLHDLLFDVEMRGTCFNDIEKYFKARIEAKKGDEYCMV